ncbi:MULTISPECIES: minor capsid protein [Aerococcus]|uniref:Phage head morphogenesis domain-containing protein n=20 Tax=Bacteria TaxID=2 RepID=A0A329P012_9LACT|nr:MULTISPECIES: minor capsid protein [Aerococcus]KAA9242179.1 hypothetical protein F6I34_01625 [Aerococcus urinae]KAA9298660.1 hypothetical protein F6I08_04780 [Aerococcus tenax]MCY3026209.1 minor capsid protein [Aerococcus loyolae]MCY3035178.1 minor capsid protein [Aerococcus mictus]MCY3064236.1 minor capsid protein [Aerococcus mictus]
MAKKNENHKEYWGRRTKELMLYADQHDIDFFKELEDIYGEAARELQKEIFEFYAKYAEDNKISYREAQQILRGTDLSDYRRRAKKYLETHDEELLSRLNQQYASSQVTRLEALQLETAYQAGVLQNSLAISFATYLKRLANHSYRKIMGGRSSSTLNKPALEQLIRTPFNGYNYSEQLWGNTDNLAQKLKETFKRGFIKGYHPREMSRDIRKDFDVQRHRAETLIRTDGSMVINNATLRRYHDAGLRYVRVHVHMDNRTSDICKELHKENKLYSIEEINRDPVLPAHYNCRSTYVPDEEELDKAYERDLKELRELENSKVQERSNSRIGYDDRHKISYDRGNGMQTAKLATGTSNEIHVSELLSRKTKAVRFYDNQFSKAYELIGNIANQFTQPKIIIGDRSEFNEGVLASYNPSENALYVRGDIKSNQDMKAAQNDTLAMNGNPLSTVIHELGHWYQYQQIKANHPEFSHEEILAREIENSKEIVDMLSAKGYNIKRDISTYANRSVINFKEFELFAEIFVRYMMNNPQFKQFVDKGVE